MRNLDRSPLDHSLSRISRPLTSPVEAPRHTPVAPPPWTPERDPVMKHLTRLLTTLITHGHGEALLLLTAVALGGGIATLGLALTLWLT